jgi:hypothetical protein
VYFLDKARSDFGDLFICAKDLLFEPFQITARLFLDEPWAVVLVLGGGFAGHGVIRHLPFRSYEG